MMKQRSARPSAGSGLWALDGNSAEMQFNAAGEDDRGGDEAARPPEDEGGCHARTAVLARHAE